MSENIFISDSHDKRDTENIDKKTDNVKSNETFDRKHLRWISEIPIFEWTTEQRDPTFSHLKMREANCGPHFHSHMEIFILHSNEQEVTINGTTMLLHAGDIAVSDSMDVHSYKYHSDSYSDIYLIPAMYLNYYNAYRGDRRLDSNFIINNQFVYQQFVEILNNIDSLSNPISQRGSINTILGMIVDACKFTTSENIPVNLSKASDREFAIRVMQYIAENISEDITSKSMAPIFHYSPNHFANRFKEVFGFNVTKYLNNVRLSKFFELSRENPYAPLTSLIFDSGFKSTTSFYRQFAEKTHMTPAQFMDEIKENSSKKSLPPPPRKKSLNET